MTDKREPIEKMLDGGELLGVADLKRMSPRVRQAVQSPPTLVDGSGVDHRSEVVDMLEEMDKKAEYQQSHGLEDLEKDGNADNGNVTGLFGHRSSNLFYASSPSPTKSNSDGDEEGGLTRVSKPSKTKPAVDVEDMLDRFDFRELTAELYASPAPGGGGILGSGALNGKERSPGGVTGSLSPVSRPQALRANAPAFKAEGRGNGSDDRDSGSSHSLPGSDLDESAHHRTKSSPPGLELPSTATTAANTEHLFLNLGTSFGIGYGGGAFTSPTQLYKQNQQTQHNVTDTGGHGAAQAV